MKNQQSKATYAFNEDSQTQFAPLSNTPRESRRQGLTADRHDHGYQINSGAGLMDTQMDIPRRRIHPKHTASRLSLGTRHADTNAQQIAYEKQILLAYPRQNTNEPLITGYSQATTHTVDTRAVNAKHTVPNTLYPVRAPYVASRESRRTRKTIIGVLIALILGSTVAFVTMNLDSIVANRATLAAPALDASSDDESAAQSLAVAEAGETAIIATAFVRPARHADLSLSIAGLVTELHVSEGNQVLQGQPLLNLDSSQQVVAVAQANASLAQAKARLEELMAGSHAEEIQAAQSVVDSAKAQLASLLERATIEDEQAAVAQLRAAEAQFNALYREPDGEAVIAARAELKNAEAALSRAQSAFNEVSWRSNVGMLPESQDLQTATNNFEAARAKLDALFADPTPSDVSQAQAQISDAQAALQRLRNPNKQSDIAAAEAEVRRAEANLRLLQSGTRSEVLAFAQAEFEAAEASVLEAEVQLAKTKLTAPFEGTIVTLDAEVGEYLQPGIGVAQIGELNRWLIETDDLIELDVINVAEGAPVRIIIDSMPGLDLTGTVVRVRRIGENKVGDITYTVYIEPDRYVPELAWNMTASVHIERTPNQGLSPAN